jgi:neutral/alkaline ceramidase-like enzyme
MIRSLVFGLGFVLTASSVLAQEAKPWKAGVARINITPEKLMWMSGYGARNKPAEGKLTDLWAKALALEDPSGKRGLLITMDLVGIERGLSQEVCTEIQKEHKLPREAIIVSASHTHCGPVVRSNLGVMYDLDDTQRRYVHEYGESLRQKLVQVADDALRGLGPVSLQWGIGQATFAVNRRNNPEKDVPRLKQEGKLKGPVDHDVPVLVVKNQGDKLIAVVFGYACHATVLSFYQWCGDYPGFAQAELEAMYPGSTALFWAGCGGDQNPLPRRTVALAKDYGRQLATGVAAVLQQPTRPIAGGLAMTYREIELPFDALPTREQLAKDTLSENKNVARRAAMLLKQLEKQGSLRGHYPYPVQVWRLGDEVDWITLGGEVVVDYALRLKKEVGPDKTWVMGYANDVMAYIPSLRVLKEGGYEGGGAMVIYGLPTVWGPRVEEVIVGAVHEQVKRLRGR